MNRMIRIEIINKSSQSQSCNLSFVIRQPSFALSLLSLYLIVRNTNTRNTTSTFSAAFEFIIVHIIIHLSQNTQLSLCRPLPHRSEALPFYIQIVVPEIAGDAIAPIFRFQREQWHLLISAAK